VNPYECPTLPASRQSSRPSPTSSAIQNPMSLLLHSDTSSPNLSRKPPGIGCRKRSPSAAITSAIPMAIWNSTRPSPGRSLPPQWHSRLYAHVHSCFGRSAQRALLVFDEEGVHSQLSRAPTQLQTSTAWAARAATQARLPVPPERDRTLVARYQTLSQSDGFHLTA